jgi:hypothetical protein
MIQVVETGNLGPTTCTPPIMDACERSAAISVTVRSGTADQWTTGLIEPSAEPDAASVGHQSPQPGNIQVGDAVDMPAADPRDRHAQESRDCIVG